MADVMVFHSVYDDAVMTALAADYQLHRYDSAENKTAFLAEYGPLCRSLVINGHTVLDESHLRLMPNLQLVACSSAGFETIDTQALKEHGIRLTNTAAALSDDVADMAVLLMLAARRDLVRAHDYVKSGRWAEQGMYALQSSLKTKALGLVGFGRIGQEIAARAAALKLEIGYHCRSEKPDSSYLFFADIKALARWADILIVIVPGGPDTEQLIDKEIMKQLGPEGLLINLSRGSVVDETALIQALKTGQLGRAGLDVYMNEPHPNPALTSLDNVTLYPHHSSGTAETRAAMSQLVADNLAAFYAGRPLLTPVF